MDKKQFDKMFYDYKDKLGLRERHIKYKLVRRDDGLKGQVKDRSFEYQQANIEFSKCLLNDNKNYIKEVIKHELLHCLLSFRERDQQNMGAEILMDETETRLYRDMILGKEEIVATLLARKFK